ncbi:MAG: peptidoglycan-binding domain-containing protein [Kiloniellaceae bacterium]
MPTNAVHTTKRRLKRGLGQNRILTILAIAALAGLVILSSQQPEPPALTPLERQAADAPSRAIDAAGEMVFPLTIAIPVETALHGKKASAHSESPVETTVLDRPETGSRIESPLEVAAPNVEGPSAETGAPVGAAPDAWPETQAPAATAELNPEELAEMERMLARLELEPSKPDGVVDRRTKSAIRLYQQIAGLPVDGEPTQALLADMRAVVRIFEAGN